jgi:hypothetical protein
MKSGHISLHKDILDQANHPTRVVLCHSKSEIRRKKSEANYNDTIKCLVAKYNEKKTLDLMAAERQKKVEKSHVVLWKAWKGMITEYGSSGPYKMRSSCGC